MWKISIGFFQSYKRLLHTFGKSVPVVVFIPQKLKRNNSLQIHDQKAMNLPLKGLKGTVSRRPSL